MNPEKILIISDEFPPEGGGAGVIAKRLVLDCAQAGHDVTLICGSNDTQREQVLPDEKQHFVRRITLLWVLSYKLRFAWIKPSGFDIIILNDFVSAYLAGLWFSKEVLARCVIIVHGNDSHFVFQRNTHKHRWFRYTGCYLRALNHCRKVVAVSRYARELYLNYANGNVSPDKVVYCYAGISKSDFDTTLTVTREELNLPEESRVLFTACRLIEDKGIFNQLELFEQLTRKIPNLYWLVAGEGEDKQRFKESVEKKGLQDRVRLLGFIPRKNLGAYYRMADIFWMLSVRDGETMGLVYLEAALFGTPSIGLKKYGVVEVIDEGKSGYFYADETFYRDVSHCLEHDMGDSCIRHADSYSSSDFASFLIDQ